MYYIILLLHCGILNNKSGENINKRKRRLNEVGWTICPNTYFKKKTKVK